ncbi:conjugal transfer protein TraD [Acetobacter persici]|uniref:conjugal transfer protein TraD n=1 Tax=Acetobacter persici TaxID=1076596 RepID=UPI001BA8EDD3|nr:conjugal transfer protein TraD [Acetobacter persici]
MAQNNWGHPKNQVLIAEIEAADISVLKGRRKKIRDILALTELTSIDKETLLALLEAERLRVEAREAASKAAKAQKRFEDQERAQRTRKLILLGNTVREAKLPEGNRERLLAALLMVKERLAGTDPKNPFPNISESYLSQAREIIAKEKKKRQS